ncbi:hypothetical protein GGR34_001133 [Microvirga flocculans]|uniref:Porin n=1 Tax=Microvirga flocculans TaxID=217168 RepID=A0A7W6IE57_9HYPH|nr:porin [Microvirga flocculans]MBB4039491.1 hypothetical protein [Microvirga flocculans]
MKLVKSLFLGSVAGLAAVAGAQAADLPSKKAAAVEYVRVCSTYGAGFFYIPGTETCLRVGGRVRAEYRYLEPLTRAEDSIGFRARGRVQLDARTATAYGLLRTFVRLEITRNTGVYAGGGVSSSAEAAQAFIQFGGLTAGRAPSFFVNQDLPTTNWGTVGGFYDFPDVNLLAYTFSFGNGFSASLSLEDGEGTNVAGAPYFSPAGERVPDVVANVKYAGTWGSAQLSGVVHQLRSAAIAGPTGLGFIPDTEYGWAVSGQVGINLPMIAAGDALWVAATYADGALSYLGLGTSNSVGSTLADVAEAYYNPVTGDIDTGAGWGVFAGIRHYWTPTIRQSLFGSYVSVSYDNSGSLIGLPDFNEWRVGSNLIWSPVSGLDIGVEVLYANMDRDPVGLVAGSSDDRWEGRLRIQRDF